MPQSHAVHSHLIPVYLYPQIQLHKQAQFSAFGVIINAKVIYSFTMMNSNLLTILLS